jgi:FtsH-binding integral membrane protein
VPKEQKDQTHSCGGGIKHMLLMMVCCLAPLGLVLLLQRSGNVGVASYLVLLLCPLMHFFMMRGMGHKSQSAVEGKEPNQSQ